MQEVGSSCGQSNQTEVIEFLGRPATHGEGVTSVDRIETHGALVFLAANDVYKIKRAVCFPYMDFSTLALRRRACEREFELNRPHAPALYLGVVPVVRLHGGVLAIGGSGEVVEWAVHMRRFDQADLLGSIADRGGIDGSLARSIADAVFDDHSHAAVDGKAGPFNQIGAIIAELEKGLCASGMRFSLDDISLFETRCRHHLDAAKNVLERRAEHGRVRRCHGDLHLDNIVMWQGRPTLFDALEFDERLARIDTLYDLAFLLMDLDRRGHRGAANIVLNRYLWRSQELLDIEGLAAMPLFLALRAGIRAMVSAQRGLQAGALPGASYWRSADHFMRTALGYLSPPRPLLIAVGGISGTGKSTLAAALAPSIGAAPGAIHFRSDLERKALFGAAETERLSQACYAAAVGEEVYALLSKKAKAALRTGFAVILDAAFLQREQKTHAEQVAAELSVPFHGLWLEAPRDILLERIAARTGDASDASVDVVRRQLAGSCDAVNWTPIDASGSAGETLIHARSALGLRP